jgi:MinD-like ATPase involved in chromosome partitioning or flagellar assembly
LNIDLKDHLEKSLKIKYAKDKEEWVDVYITPLNRIDITIVSNEAEFLDSIEVGTFTVNAIKEFAGEDAGKYSIGFLEFYTDEEAENLDIHKHETERKPITWSDVVSLNKELQSKEQDRPYRVICFYSYKGGVGRTTALIQVAYILAKQGRNVVLVDLDIEAPSFHLIFKEWVDDPIHGVKYGLVDYLYERMVNVDPKDHKIKISDIFVPIHFDEALDGNIYVFPATKELSYEYIFKLTQLQSNIIFENKYMEEIMDSLEKSLKFDTVFIDSRTGINQWGAFSLLGLADQTMLIASPNEENIEGLSSIIDLMKRAGLDNYVVAMSKIETDARGISLAKHYFDKLKSDGQEFIGIGYNPAIATIERYPFADILEPYKVLSDYIIENQIVNFNEEFLKELNVREKSSVKEVIGKISTDTGKLYRDICKISGNVDKTSIDDHFETITNEIITNAESKILTDKNINIITGEKEDIERLFGLFKKHASKKRSEFIQNEDGRSLIAYKELIPIFEQNYYKDFGNFLKEHDYMKDCENKGRVWLGYLLYLINKNINRNDKTNGNNNINANIKQKENQGKEIKEGSEISKYEEIGKGKELEAYIEFMLGADEEQIISMLKDTALGDITIFDSIKNSIENVTGLHDIVVCMFNIHEIVDAIYDVNSNNANGNNANDNNVNDSNANSRSERYSKHNNGSCNKQENYLIRSLCEKELVKGLTDCIMFCKKHVPSIRVLFAHSYDFVIEHQEELSRLKGSRIDLEWKEEDVKMLVLSCVNMGLDINLRRAYADSMLKNEKIFGRLLNSDMQNHVSCRQQYELEIQALMDSPVFRQRILDLFWGIRASTKRYSKPMITWFYDELSNLGNINDKTIISIINMAIDFETQELQGGTKKGSASKNNDGGNVPDTDNDNEGDGSGACVNSSDFNASDKSDVYNTGDKTDIEYDIATDDIVTDKIDRLVSLKSFKKAFSHLNNKP